MILENFENIVSLLCTTVGLLYCVFKYIENPRRGYRFITVFFLANFLSEYYWTIYELIMRSSPDVSEFAAYFGWNVGFLMLALAAFFIRRKEARRYFHPVILLPILTNVPQFILYIQYGGILNNVWEVGVTTVCMIFCLQDIVYYAVKKKERGGFPLFSLLVLLYLVLYYGMWTSSCFSWENEFLNPYLYCSIAGAVISVFFAFGAKKYYETKAPANTSENAAELRLRVLIQALVTIIIVGISVVGFFIAYGIKNSLAESGGIEGSEKKLVIFLFVISAVIIFLILALIYFMTLRYRRILAQSRKMNEGKRGRVNFISTIVLMLVLLIFAGIYNNVILYNASVVSVYEDGEEAIKTTATELENYLTVAVTTLRVTADSVDLMEKNGSSVEEIRKYIVDQTTMQAQQFDENFTGLYAYVNGEYLDGLEWTPPEGYDPAERDWYKIAVAARGEVVIVSPYVDAQTGSVVITVARSIAGADNSLTNVVALDVIVNHIKEVTQAVEIAGKGYGMVVNTDGFIIAHKEEDYNGKSLTDIYGGELLDVIMNEKTGRTTAKINGENCTLFIAPVMDQWRSVIVIGDSELFEDTYSQLTVNVTVSFVTFFLIAFLYYIGYKNEQLNARRVEEMNLQVVSALAAAIDAKDDYTKGHSSRVAEYARRIAARSGFSKSEQDDIYMMALLHDVGKIGVPDEVINKPSKLTDEEFALIRRHPVIGGSILGSIKEKPQLAIGARWHHERLDGSGYPDGISEDQIPAEVRIIAVADAYDAMTSRRSYRGVMPQEKVRYEIEHGMGTQFDPRFAKVMLEMMDEDKDFVMREKTTD